MWDAIQADLASEQRDGPARLWPPMRAWLEAMERELPWVPTAAACRAALEAQEGLVHNSNQLTSGCVEFSVRLCF